MLKMDVKKLNTMLIQFKWIYKVNIISHYVLTTLQVTLAVTALKILYYFRITFSPKI